MKTKFFSLFILFGLFSGTSLFASERPSLGVSLGSPTLTFTALFPLETVSFNLELGISYIGLDHAPLPLAGSQGSLMDITFGNSLTILTNFIPSVFVALDLHFWQPYLNKDTQFFFGIGARYLFLGKWNPILSRPNTNHALGVRLPLGVDFKLSEKSHLILKTAPGVSFSIPEADSPKRDLASLTNFSLDMSIGFLWKV